METVTIVGAGHQGLAMAAHLGSNGVRCQLWNRSRKGIADVLAWGVVSSRGVVEGDVPVFEASTDIEAVLSKTVLVATPSSAHRDIARMLAPLVDSTYIVVLNPGRTFGALDFARSLELAGCRDLPLIAETQTIVYTCRRDSSNGVRVFALKDGIPLASLQPGAAPEIISKLPACLRDRFVSSASMVSTSLGNVGMVLHCAPTLMNVGWIESADASFEYYYDGISPTIARLLEKVDAERLAVADRICHPIESVGAWLERTYGTKGSGLYELLQNNEQYRGIDAPSTVHHRYIEEDVPNGLVPLESLAVRLGVPVPAVSAVVSLACETMGTDFRETGRRVDLYNGLVERFGVDELVC